jgi:hypothetical protein
MPVGSAEVGNDAVALVSEAHQLRSSLHRDAELLQPLDQQPLVLVLWEDLQEGISGQILADGREGETRRRFSLHPQVDRGNLVAMLHHEVGEVELPVEFEGTRMNREGARGRAGLRRLVDDAHPDAELGEPSARTRPVGPAPMIRTSLCILSFSVSKSTVSRSRPSPALELADNARRG